MRRGINLGDLRLPDPFEDEIYDRPLLCDKCGKMLKYMGIGEYKCEACGYTQYDAYGLVRNYVERNPGVNVLKVEKVTGVSRKVINGMVKAGKLDIKAGSMKLAEEMHD